MAKPKRKPITRRTLKILFARSGNQCAHPGCAVPIIGPATENSDDIVIGQIGHIYPHSGERGPRGKSGPAPENPNSHENLILLCPNHHRIVDGQHETYPTETLRSWKREHEAKTSKSDDSGSLSKFRYLRELVDQKIRQETDVIRKSRFFEEFDHVGASLGLARKLIEGEFSWGTDAARSRALAWCARMLSAAEKMNEAGECLDASKSLKDCEEAKIAEAFILSRKKDKKTASAILDGIDSPRSRSARLMIASHDEGLQGAVDWFAASGARAEDMDSDGKLFLLTCRLELADWDEARDCLDVLTGKDFRQAPMLHYLGAIAHLSMAVPAELRAVSLDQPLFDAARRFPLASDEEGVRERREARKHFVKAQDVAKRLNFADMEKTCEEYAFWLDLRDHEKERDATKRLEDRLRDPSSSLHLVNLALVFQVDLNLKTVEREIDRRKAPNGKIPFDAARARFGIRLTRKTPEDVASYLDRYQDDLSPYYGKKSLLVYKIKMFCEAGRPDKAKKALAALKKEKLSEDERAYVDGTIAEVQRGDPVEAVKKRSKKLPALMGLVDELEAKKEWKELCEYGRTLFEKTRDLSDMKRLAYALINTQRNGELVELAEANMYTASQSEELKKLYCIALYREGELLKARRELKKLKDRDHNDETCRTLRRDIAISMGDWSELSAVVAGEYSERKDRSARELIGAAEAAVRLNLPGARELTIEAATKGPDDAEILTLAPLLALSAGWGDDEKARQWFEKAVSVSGDDGPVRAVPMEDFKNFLEENLRPDQQTPDIPQKLARGEIPMFLAGHALNRSLFDLMLRPALGNPSEKDPRRRDLIPAYSGTRLPTSMDIRGTVGIDATALITLSVLGLLDKALDAFDKVRVPHSTLAWLLEEKSRAGLFHQPNLIKNAREVQSLLAAKMLEEFVPTAAPVPGLFDQVENDLAVLIAEAENTEEGDDIQRVVVRSAPVYRPGSWMKEEADLTEHARVMASCGSVIRKLRQKGRITEEREESAHAYLRHNETAWPDEPEISDGAILYLDDLSVMSLLHLEILGELKHAGLRPLISRKMISRINYILSGETIYLKINDAIEQMRVALNSRIESGKVKVARQLNTDERTGMQLHKHPTAGIFAMVGLCDAIIVDDRFVNKNPSINFGDDNAPVFSTLDLLDTLGSSGSMAQEEWREHRTRLCRAGYFFVPVGYEELKHHLDASIVLNGKIAETPELRTIRESILCVKMNHWRRTLIEWFWLEESLTAFTRLLKDLWTGEADFAETRVRSDWIIDQINIHALVRIISLKKGPESYEAKFGKYVLMMLLSGDMVSRQVREEYWKWVEDKILAPIKKESPDSYSWIVEVYKEEIARLTEMLYESVGNYND